MTRPAEGEQAKIRAGLLDDDPPAFNTALREILLALVEAKDIWFDSAAAIAETAEQEGPRAALVDLALLYAFDR